MLEITRQTSVPTSWAEIKEYAQADKLRELMQLGDELPVELKTGEKVTLQLCDLTLGDRPCFVLKDCMKDEKPMNKRATNAGGWEKSFMREWLNETIFRQLPDELQEIIVPRTIKQKLGDATVETADMLWLPSFTEMFGTGRAADWAPADTGDTQFQLFSLTNEQKAALWQMQNKSWKPRNNPYNTAVSERIYNALNAEQSGGGGLKLPSLQLPSQGTAQEEDDAYTSGIMLPTAEQSSSLQLPSQREN